MNKRQLYESIMSGVFKSINESLTDKNDFSEFYIFVDIINKYI